MAGTPRSFAYSEATLIVLAAACLLLLLDEQWVLAGLAAALATGQRASALATERAGEPALATLAGRGALHVGDGPGHHAGGVEKAEGHGSLGHGRDDRRVGPRWNPSPCRSPRRWRPGAPL